MVDEPFGRVHRIRSPLSYFVSKSPGATFRNAWVAFHAPLLQRPIETFLRRRAGVFIVHSFSSWGWLGVRARNRLSTAERRIVPIVSMYTTWEHEYGAKCRAPDHGVKDRISVRLQRLWVMPSVRRLERQSLQHSDLVLVNYDSVMRLIHESGASPSRIIKIPYTSEWSLLDGAAMPRRIPPPLKRLEPHLAPLIVSVSRHDPRKGLDILLQALNRLRDRGVTFRACLVSHGALIDAHRRLAHKLKLDDSTAIPGYVPDPVTYLNAADLFVLPSLEEGSGSISLIEALQAGLAIVASNVDGIPEDVTDGDCALLVPPGDVGALSSALARLITDEGLRRRLQRRAREVFVEKFSASVFTEGLRSLYNNLLETPTSGPETGLTELTPGHLWRRTPDVAGATWCRRQDRATSATSR